jgi:chromosomal replication initiation ATPase DnaA
MKVTPQSGQLVLSLPAREGLRRSDFFVSPANAAALAAVDGWQGWPEGRMLLTGPVGAGKTHLAALWAEATGAAVVAGADLGRADLPALAQRGFVAVDDAQAVAGGQAEAALFHLHNLLAGAGHLLVTAPSPPRDWGLRLPDLLSRMQALAITPLAAPDDALLSAVLVKLFADRQIEVQAALIPWLVARMERSVAAARGIVATLDAAALAEKRAITIALARAALPGLA